MARPALHIDIMFGHQKNVWRCLLLAGLLVFLSGIGSEAWAQYVVSQVTETPATFPYLSPDLTQRNMLINAYQLQMRLFASIAGDGAGALKTLYYLALLGCLIGALLMIFNAKYQKPSIIASWLLLVIIVVFSPLGSTLIFHAVDESEQKLTSGFKMETEGKFTSCQNMPERCGFTPQLAAIHIASTLQLTFSDLFNSMSWTGLMENFTATQAMKEADFNIVPDNVIPEINNYVSHGCTFNTKQLANRIHGVTAATDTPTPETPATPDAAERLAPLTMADSWSKIQTFYNTFDEGDTTAPPAIVLYDDTDYKAAEEKYHWNANDRHDYEEGLTYLYRTFVADSNQTVVKIDGTCTGCASSAISAQAALEAINTLDPSPFLITNGAALYPGLFITWKGSTYADEKSTDGGTFSMATISPAQARSCYLPARSERASNSTQAANMAPPETKCDTAYARVSVMRPGWHRDMVNEMRKLPYDRLAGNRWAPYSTLLNPPVRPLLAKMPVGIKDYTLAATPGEMPAAGEVQNVFDCKENGEAVVKRIAEIISQRASRLDKLKAILLEEGEVPVPPERFTIAHLSSIEEDSMSAEFQVVANTFVKTFNTRIDLEPRGANLTPERIRAILLSQMLEYAKDATNKKMEKVKGTSAAEKEAGDTGREIGKGVDVVGWGFLTWLGGGLAATLGGWLMMIASNFIGPLAAAVVYFTSLLVDFAMMAIIVLTPFLFLAGLFIPTMAMGVMTVAVMGAFLLKFVPVTLIILNNLAMMLYQFIAVGAEDKESVMQSMLIIAMSGLYMNLVGMTFFLIFKLGDPAAILGRFTAIDGSAKEMGQRGMAAAYVAAAFAAKAVIGPAVAAAGLPFLKGGDGKPKPAPNPDGAGGLQEQVAASAGSFDSMAGVREDQGINDNPLSLSESLMNSFTEEGKEKFGLNDTQMKNIMRGESIEHMGRMLSLQQDSDGAWFLEAKDTNGLIAKGMNEFGLDKGQMENMFNGQSVLHNDGSGNMLYSLREDENGNWNIHAETAPATPHVTVDGDRARAQDNQKNEQLSGNEALKGAKEGVGTGPMTEQGIGSTSTKPQGADNQDAAAEPVTSQNLTLQQQQQLEQQQRQQQLPKQPPPKPQPPQQTQPEWKSQDQQQQQAGPGSTLVAPPPTPAQPPQAVPPVMDAATKATMPLSASSPGQQLADEISAMRPRFDQLKDVTNNYNEETIKRLRSTGQMLLEDSRLIDRMKTLLTDEGRETLDVPSITSAAMDMTKGSDEVARFEREMRAKADMKPSLGRTMLSGFYGSVLGGVGGGLARIPILGPAISESLNEFHQAPERARAWNDKGFAEWFKAQGDAKRNAFMKKELGPIAAAAEYQSMTEVGAFKVQYDMSREAAKEAVQKGRSQFEAMMANKFDEYSATHKARVKSQVEVEPDFQQEIRGITGSDRDSRIATKLEEVTRKRLRQEFRTKVNAGEVAGDLELDQLYSLGRMDAVARVKSVKQEAAVMSGRSLMVRAVKGGLTDEMKLHIEKGDFMVASDGKSARIGKAQVELDDVRVTLTSDLLNKTTGDLMTKKIAGQIDDMKLAHYGIMEKQFSRGKVDWNSTRDLTTSAEAASKFAALDTDTDYRIGGHMKMVEGKQRYMGQKGQWMSFNQLRNEDAATTSAEIRNILSTKGMDVVLKDAGFSAAKYAGQAANVLEGAQREVLEKAAKASLSSKGVTLRLDALYDNALTTGRIKPLIESATAPYNMDAQREALSNAVERAMSSSVKINPGYNKKADSRLLVLHPNGTRDSLEAGLEIYVEAINKATQNDLTKGKKATDIFNKLITEDIEAMAINQMTDAATRDKIGYTGFTKDSYDRFTNDLRAAGLGDVADRFDQRVNKNDITQTVNLAEITIHDKGGSTRDAWKHKKP